MSINELGAQHLRKIGIMDAFRPSFIFVLYREVRHSLEVKNTYGSDL